MKRIWHAILRRWYKWRNPTPIRGDIYAEFKLNRNTPRPVDSDGGHPESGVYLETPTVERWDDE